LKQLEKEYARQKQVPSNRQGKNAKKTTARLAIVLNYERLEEVEIIKGKNAKKLAAWIDEKAKILSEQPVVTTIKMTKLFGRLKRKPGHRGKPEEITVLDIEDNELEFSAMENHDEIDWKEKYRTGYTEYL